jgi:hypothetical protein
MANKKISELQSRTPALSDLMLVGDPSSGYSYKCTVTALATIIETDIADGYVTLSTTQTISGAKTFTNAVLISANSPELNLNQGTSSVSYINFKENSSLVNRIISSGASLTFITNNSGTSALVLSSSQTATFGSIPNATIDTDKFLVSDGGTLKYRTGAELLSDIGAASSSNISGTTNYIAKFTSSSAIGNSVIYESGGNIGIGTTTLTARLTVNGNAILSGSINATETYLSSPNGLVFQINSTNVSGGYAEFQTNSTTIGKIGTATQVVGSGGTSVFAISSVGANDFILGTNGTQRVKIDTSGNVTFSQIANATTDTDKFLVSDSGVLKYRTGSELLSDIGGASSSSVSGTTNYIPKFTSSSAIGNSAIYDNSGSILIGTTTTNGFKFKVSDNGGAEFAFLPNDGGVNNFTNYNRSTASYMPLLINALNQQFYISGSEQMRLTSTGLGIGTSSPAANLQVNASSSPGIAFSSTNSTTSGSRGDLSWFNSSISTVALIRGTAITDNVGTQLEFYTRPAAGSLTQRMTLDASGNLGLGVTPSAWDATNSIRALQLNAGSLWSYSTSALILAQNSYSNTSGQRTYTNNGYASEYEQANSQHIWKIAPSGTAGNTISFTQAMTLDASGRLGVGTSSPNAKFEVAGTSANTDFRISRTVSSSTYLYINAPGGTPSTSVIGINGTDVMSLNASGNVGIGTTSPNAKLELNSASGNTQLLITSTSGTYPYISLAQTGVATWSLQNVATSGLFTITEAGVADRLVIAKTSGNVGIGTTSPSEKLEVNGNIKTAAPSGGTAKPWKLGEAGVTLGGSNTSGVRVEIDGVVYYLVTGYLP